jgi:hypothetical protein
MVGVERVKRQRGGEVVVTGGGREMEMEMQIEMERISVCFSGLAIDRLSAELR